jgi:hypothetical protein
MFLVQNSIRKIRETEAIKQMTRQSLIPSLLRSSLTIRQMPSNKSSSKVNCQSCIQQLIPWHRYWMVRITRILPTMPPVPREYRPTKITAHLSSKRMLVEALRMRETTPSCRRTTKRINSSRNPLPSMVPMRMSLTMGSTNKIQCNPSISLKLSMVCQTLINPHLMTLKELIRVPSLSQETRPLAIQCQNLMFQI